MPGLGDIAEWLFGIDPIDNSRNVAQQQYLDQQAKDYAVREQQDYLRQLGYGQMLDAQIKGTGIPSTAQRQLVEGMDMQNRAAASRVAGLSGNNAALGNYASVLGVGDASSQLNAQQAVLRAQEAANAQNQLGALYSNMGQRSMQGYGTALQTGLGYGQLGTSVDIANQRAKAAAAGTLLSTAGALGASAIGGPAAPAAAAAGQAAGNAYAAAQPGYGASLSAGPQSYTMNDYSAAAPGYGASLTAGDQPQDSYQASYSNGYYRSPSTSTGQR